MKNYKEPFRIGGMSKVNIERRLAEVCADYLDSIEDFELKKRLSTGMIITGGAIASLLLGEKVNDYDIYLRNEDLVRDIRAYYYKRLPSNSPDWNPDSIDEYLEDNGHLELNPDHVPEGEEVPKPFQPIIITSNALSLRGNVQIITRFCGEPEEIHKSYDFIHVTNYYEHSTGRLYLNADALESLLCKQLRYQGSEYPVCSILRVRKFLKRGWTINGGQLLKIMLQISDLDLRNVHTLQEQLIGVDTLYFRDLLDDLKNKDVQVSDHNSLASAIDKIFG